MNDTYTLDRWIADMPGGRFLPPDWKDNEPKVEVVVTDFGWPEKDLSLVYRLFKQEYTPMYPDTEEEDGDLYLVPQLVAEILQWYGGGDENGYVAEWQ